jgi:hypothetical protein
MNKKIIYIPIILYFFIDIFEMYSKENYFWTKIALVTLIITFGLYLKIFKRKK